MRKSATGQSFSAPQPDQRPNRLQTLQALRFFAASAVLIHHVIASASIAQGLEYPRFISGWNFGGLGIDVFFVLSGYVITLQVGTPPLRFGLHRLARIYPAFLCSLVLATAMLYFVGTLPASTIRFDWSFLLLPAGQVQTWNFVPYWTLMYEMAFYAAIFCFMLCGTKAFDFLLTAWIGVIVVMGYHHPIEPQWTANWKILITNPLCLMFIAGALLARAHRGTIWPGAAFLALVFLPNYWGHFIGTESAVIGIGIAGVMQLCILAETHIRVPNILIRGGDVSYGLYLIHHPIDVALCAVLPSAPNLLWPIIGIMIIIAGGGGLLFGWADHVFYRWIKSTIDIRLRPKPSYDTTNVIAPARVIV